MSALTPISAIGRHACYRCELGASARHKAANLGVAVTVVIRPHNGKAETVGLSHNGIIGHYKPFSLNADTIMALLCVPIDVLHTDTVGKSAAQPTASFSFPSAAPSDAKHWPFSGIARVSHAREPSELIPCIRRQIPGIALADSDPQKWALRFLSAFLRL